MTSGFRFSTKKLGSCQVDFEFFRIFVIGFNFNLRDNVRRSCTEKETREARLAEGQKIIIPGTNNYHTILVIIL